MVYPTDRVSRIGKWLIVVGMVGGEWSSAIGQNARLEKFEGGDMFLRGELRSTLLTGPGVMSATYGFTLPYPGDPFGMFGNPASLGEGPPLRAAQSSPHLISQNSSPRLALSLYPQLDVTVTRFTDLSGTVQTAVDDATSGFETTSEKVYPQLEVNAQRPGTLVGGLALHFPLIPKDDQKRPLFFDHIGLGFYQSLHMRLRAIYSGMRMRLRTIEDTPEKEIVMLAAMGIDADLTAEAYRWTGAVSRHWGTKMRTGLAIDFNQLTLKGYALHTTEGILSMAGNTSAFNDPSDPWENRLKGEVKVDWTGTGVGMRLGQIWELSSRLNLGTVLSLQAPIAMKGEGLFEVFRFPALKLNAPEGEDQFDVDQIDPAEKTRTQRRDIEAPHQVKILLPNSLSLGIAAKTICNPHLSLTRYFGGLEWRVKMRESGGERAYKRGIVPQWGAHLGLDLFLVHLGAGVVTFTDISEGYRDQAGNPLKDGNRFLIPHLTVAFQADLSHRITFQTLVVGLPEDALRLTLTYQLPEGE